MGRKRTTPLPRGIYERRWRSGKVSYWVDFTDQNDVRQQLKGGDTVAQAVAFRAQCLREVAAGTFDPGVRTGEQLLTTYARGWIESRRAEGKSTVDREEQLLRDYVLPRLGKLPIARVRPKHVAQMVRDLGPLMSPKSVRNAHGVLSAMLARARFDELVSDNAAAGLPRGVLPPLKRVREIGAWTRDEAESLISDESIPEDRRVAYAIATFTGARVGEVAGMRWRDLDTKAQPLWLWMLRTQYDGAELKTKQPRDIPIHPELARILAAWKLDGWVQLTTRHPTADDFVVPREDGTVHSDSSLGAKAVHRHAALIGLASAGRDFHSFRRTMITCARTDGADDRMLERITHNARGTMIDRYSYFEWPELCATVAKLRIGVRRHAAVIRLAASDLRDAARDVAENGGEMIDEKGGGGGSRRNRQGGPRAVSGGEREGRANASPAVAGPDRAEKRSDSGHVTRVTRGDIKALRVAAEEMRRIARPELALRLETLADRLSSPSRSSSAVTS